MNQDFYAFCQEPDPLNQINAFQQLAANNAETTDLFDRSSLTGFGAATFGNLDMGTELDITDENEGIEAGQILQSLSVAGDQRSSSGKVNL